MTEPPVISRRQARRDAMVVLYQRDITGGDYADLYANLQKDRGYEPSPYTRELVEGVNCRREEIDGRIDRYSINWPAHRIAALERNILRIGVFEIGFRDDIPAETSIDEAVGLAKRYCSREAGVLINGILGKMVEEGEAADGN